MANIICVLFLLILPSNIVQSVAQTETVDELDNYSVKFLEWAVQFSQKVETLFEFRLDRQASDLYRVESFAVEYGNSLSHLSDLLKIYHMSGEKNVHDFCKGRIEGIKSQLFIAHNQIIKEVNAHINYMQTADLENLAQQTRQFQMDLIAVGVLLQKLPLQ